MQRMFDQVEKLLEEMRPAFRRHGGNIALVDVEEETGIVHVKLEGSCKGCPFSTLTLKSGVEAMLKEQVPGVTNVIAVNQ